MIAIMPRPLFRFLRNEGAVATIEAAIVMPFVLVLGLGTIEFGWLMTQIESVQTGLRDAVRYVSRSQISVDSSYVGSLPAAVSAAASVMMSDTYERNGITSGQSSFILVAEANTGGLLYRGGSNVYSILGTADFTPASAGLLALANLTLPRITLRYEARHAGG
jgi:Flp pilus assembly protein TadG